MGKPDAPDPIPAKDTASASTSTNVATAIANAFMGNVNENTPDGKTVVNQTGQFKWKDPFTGDRYKIPTFTRNTKLSPAQQAIKDQQDQTKLGLSELANNQTGFLSDYMSKPFDGSNDATEARLLELGRQRLDPILAQQDEGLRTRLANQGIKVGTEAYDREMASQGQNRNDAYNNLILSGHGQAFQEGQTMRNQPINEITALMSGSQVSQPNFQGTGMPTIPTTDTAGLMNEEYNQKMAQWQVEMAQRNSILGGLFGLGSAFIKASDERVKENITPLGNVEGHNVYEYDYKGKFDDGEKHVGVMAQEVEKKRPDAVLTGKDGVKRVHYGRLFGLGEAA